MQFRQGRSPAFLRPLLKPEYRYTARIDRPTLALQGITFEVFLDTLLLL